MSVNFYRTTRRHIPEDISIHIDRCESPKFKKSDSAGSWAGICELSQNLI
jgi:hypothetical protein